MTERVGRQAFPSSFMICGIPSEPAQGTELKTDPFTLAAIMGHANLRTIMRYVHPDQPQQKQAMERYAAAMRRRKMRRVK
jgi:hypothetical protein